MSISTSMLVKLLLLNYSSILVTLVLALPVYVIVGTLLQVGFTRFEDFFMSMAFMSLGLLIIPGIVWGIFYPLSALMLIVRYVRKNAVLEIAKLRFARVCSMLGLIGSFGYLVLTKNVLVAGFFQLFCWFVGTLHSYFLEKVMIKTRLNVQGGSHA